MATQKTLLEETLFLLDKDKRNLMQLSKDSELGYHWLHRLRKREIPEPSIVKIEKLYKALTLVQA